MKAPTSLPSRSLVRLSCGHERRVRDKKRHEVFYCLTCDDFAPIKDVLQNHKDH